MSSQSIRINLSKDRKGKIKVKVNGSRKEKGLGMQKRKKMWHHKRSLMQLDKDMDHNSRLQHRGDGTGQLECSTCSKEHLKGYQEHFKGYCRQTQGGRPQIYSAQEAQTVGDFGQSVSRIYVALDNRDTDHQVSIIEMEEVHAKFWLVQLATSTNK